MRVAKEVVPPYHVNLFVETACGMLNHRVSVSTPAAISTVVALVLGNRTSLEPALLVVKVGAPDPAPFHSTRFPSAPLR